MRGASAVIALPAALAVAVLALALLGALALVVASFGRAIAPASAPAAALTRPVRARGALLACALRVAVLKWRSLFARLLRLLRLLGARSLLQRLTPGGAGAAAGKAVKHGVA